MDARANKFFCFKLFSMFSQLIIENTFLQPFAAA